MISQNCAAETTVASSASTRADETAGPYLGVTRPDDLLPYTKLTTRKQDALRDSGEDRLKNARIFHGD